MGLKTTDLAPISVIGPTAITPSARSSVAKYFAVNRTDTASPVKAVLPAGATITNVRVWSSAASNAGTTATVSVGIPGNPTFFVNTADVKTAAGTITLGPKLTNLFMLEDVPQTGDIVITATYAETGTVSSAGGPFYVTIEYVR